jgi:hypothetical protein
MALLFPWPLALQIPSFSMGKVGVDEIERKDEGGERIACNCSRRCCRSEGKSNKDG